MTDGTEIPNTKECPQKAKSKPRGKYFSIKTPN